MRKYIIKRILILLPVLLLVTVFSFAIVNLAPGDAADLYVTPDATPEQIEMTRERLGLNQPVPVQYVKWLLNVLQGDLGFSFNSRMSVLPLLGTKFMATLQLMAVTLLFAYIIAIPLGIISARKQNKFIDNFITTASFVGVSVPNFFLGLGLIYVFSLQLKWLPTGGIRTLGGSGGLWDSIRHMIMPVLVLSTFYCANMTRYVRASMINIYSENYMRTAVSKGLPSRIILTRHGLRNALIPIITIIGSDIPKLIGGAVVTEQIFRWPGLGQLMITSIAARDYPVIMAVNLISAVAVLVCNLVVDILYAVVDARIRY